MSIFLCIFFNILLKQILKKSTQQQLQFVSNKQRGSKGKGGGAVDDTKGGGVSIMFINQKNQEFYEPELKQKKKSI